jgi:hypothetical protein
VWKHIYIEFPLRTWLVLTSHPPMPDAVWLNPYNRVSDPLVVLFTFVN